VSGLERVRPKNGQVYRARRHTDPIEVLAEQLHGLIRIWQGEGGLTQSAHAVRSLRRCLLMSYESRFASY